MKNKNNSKLTFSTKVKLFFFSFFVAILVAALLSDFGEIFGNLFLTILFSVLIYIFYLKKEKKCSEF